MTDNPSNLGKYVTADIRFGVGYVQHPGSSPVLALAVHLGGLGERHSSHGDPRSLGPAMCNCSTTTRFCTHARNTPTTTTPPPVGARRMLLLPR